MGALIHDVFEGGIDVRRASFLTTVDPGVLGTSIGTAAGALIQGMKPVSIPAMMEEVV
jgi:hypothetical protein